MRPVRGRCRASYPLDDGGDAHPAADAQGREAVPQVSALELVEQRAEDHRAGGPEGMTHGDGAAVDVDLLVGQVEVSHEPHGDRRERLVDLVEVDAIGAEPGL